ncbi:MAG: TatD family hydrolase [Longimicrobiales bacterium]
MWFDSHCHLTEPRFAEDADAVIRRAHDAGVVGLVTVASTVVDAAAALVLARRNTSVWSTAGVHPHEAGRTDPSAMTRVQELLQDPRVVAVGETGLDYYYDNAPRELQRRSFEWQLALAEETSLPVVVHARAADADVAAMIAGVRGRVRGVLHCFAGGRALLEAGLAADWYVSFAGMVSFRSYADQELVRQVPGERLLVETDSPYLTPVPHRGKRNEPAFVADVGAALAAIRGEDVLALAARCTANARRFYALQPEVP